MTDADRIQELEEALRAIGYVETEHDLDCEEQLSSDRCTPCIVEAALEERFST